MKLVKSPETVDGCRVIQDYDEMRLAMLNNETIYHWEFGNSMSPMLPNKGYCKVVPLRDEDEIQAGDAVFCRVNGYLMVHMVWTVSQINKDKKHYLIGSTSGSLYGWTSEVYGKAYSTEYIEDVEDDEQER